MSFGDVRERVASSRAERQRVLRERIAFGVLAVIVLVGTGFATTLAIEGSGGAASDPVREMVLPGPTLDGAPTAASSRCRTPLSPDDPLRLWIGGDSLAGSLGPALGDLVAATGVVAPVYDSRSGSGLSTPDFFDWPEHATTEMDRHDPEVVVFIMGTNDWAAPGASTGTTTSSSSEPEWRGAYAAEVRRMLEIFHGRTDRLVVWVGAPPLRDERSDAGVRAINAVAREVVGLDEHAEYFDEYGLFASEAGDYTATLPRDGKRAVRVRSDDGVHFTEAGGEVLGAAVYEVLDLRCRLDDQAVAGVEQPVVRVPGSSNRVEPESPSTTPEPSTTTSEPPTSTSSSTTSSTSASLTLPTVAG